MSDLWIDLILHFQSLTWLDWLDLLLVMVVFFALVTALQRTQATFMLRGLTMIALVLLTVELLLPLPTFGLLVRVILLFFLITVPIVFQRELRHLLENVGRSIGLTTNAGRVTEELMQPLARAVEQMAGKHIGALLVLEGEINLDEITQTGVPIGGSVSSELLGAIFYPNNPLHDGAVFIRGHKVVAAGCVLPITRRAMDGQRLGIRHRAALGLSERTDALIIVVSEETGIVSIAEGGELHQLPDQSALREHIMRFAHRSNYLTEPEPWLRSLFHHDTGKLRLNLASRARRLVARLGLALLFAVILWWFLLVGSRPLPNLEIRGVSLLVEGRPAGMTIANQLPETVDLIVRTVEEAASILDENAFVASVTVEGLPEGVHDLLVQVRARVDQPIRLIRVEPETVLVDLTIIADRTLPVTVALEDEALLLSIYEVRGQPAVEPATAQVVGPKPLVDQVAEIRATLSLSNTRGPVETMLLLVALDQHGREVGDVSLQPTEAKVRLDVDRRPNVREAGVAIVTSGEPSPGFWLSGLTAQPATVLLNGPPAVLASIGSAIATLPVDIDGAAGDLIVDVPLDLPEETGAQTLEGEILHAVRVTARISAHHGNLTLTRPIELVRSPAAAGLAVMPEVIELLLSGPLATLQEIEQNPTLIRLLVEARDVASGESVEQVPEVIAPEGVRVQLVPPRVTVTRE